MAVIMIQQFNNEIVYKLPLSDGTTWGVYSNKGNIFLAGEICQVKLVFVFLFLFGYTIMLTMNMLKSKFLYTRYNAARKRINTSAPDKRHRKYPYLLRDLKITHSNQACATEITYTEIKGSRAYVVAVEDLFSRKILSWKVSNTMDTDFCIDALEEALRKNEKPKIFNSDQGSQFTSDKFTSTLLDQGIKISMDGKGRALDNAHIERVWRSLKYENIFLYDYETVKDLRKGIERFFMKYNSSRPHQSLNYEVPNKVYAEGLRRIKS